MPIPEFAPRQYDAKNYTGKVAAGEDQLFEQHGRGDFEVVILRYPGVYGPRTPMNHEWAVVRRILDRRPFMILPHDGVTYFQRGYAENLARLVYLAATRPGSRGRGVQRGRRTSDQLPRGSGGHHRRTRRGDGADRRASALLRGVFPLAEKSNQLLDMSKARNLLGYRDVVDPQTATRVTARHLHDNPPDEKDLYAAGTGRFDYEREDRIVERWRRAQALMSED